MFNCDAIESLHKETGNVNLRPQELTLNDSDNTVTCGGFMINSPYHNQCRNCKDFFINNEYLRKSNPILIDNYNNAYESYKERQRTIDDIIETGKPLDIYL